MAFVQYSMNDFPCDHGTCPECGADLYGIDVEHWSDPGEGPIRCESGMKHSGERCSKCGWMTPGMCTTEAFSASVYGKKKPEV